MKKLYLIILLIIASVCFISTVEVKKVRVAVINFSGKGVETSLAEAITENLITSLIDSGTFEIIERNQLNLVMSELKLQNSDDFNDKLREQLGNLYGVELIILGSVTKIGDNYTVNIRGVEVKTAVSRFAKNITTSTVNDIPILIPLLVDIISGKKDIDYSSVLETKDKTKIDSYKKQLEVKEKQAEPTGDKILFLKFDMDDSWNTKKINIDETQYRKERFKQVIIYVENNCLEISKVVIECDDWEDDISFSDNFFWARTI